MKFTATIKGLTGFQQQFISAAEDIKSVVSNEIFAASQQFVSGAIRDAPKDTGFLAGSIKFLQNELVAEIQASSEYAPFMEFGTKGKYQPIPGTEQIAAQFKGTSTGTFMDLMRNIVRWVKRKGIAGIYSVKTRRRLGSKINQLAEDYKVAWPIALSILRNGVTPHPFFFKQQEIVWPEMVKRVGVKLKAHLKVNVIMPGEIFRPKIITI